MKIKAILHIFAVDLKQMSQVICSTDKDFPSLPEVYLDYDGQGSTPGDTMKALIARYTPVDLSFLSLKSSFQFNDADEEMVISYSILISLEDMTNGYWITESLWKFGKVDITKEAGKI